MMLRTATTEHTIATTCVSIRTHLTLPITTQLLQTRGGQSRG